MNTLTTRHITSKPRKVQGRSLAILAGALMFAVGCADQESANRQGVGENDPRRTVQQEREDQDRARGMLQGNTDRQTAPGMRVPGETIGGEPGTPGALDDTSRDFDRRQLQEDQEQGDSNL